MVYDTEKMQENKEQHNVWETTGHLLLLKRNAINGLEED